MVSFFLLLASAFRAVADKPEDLVTQLPGFGRLNLTLLGFQVYSGFLDVLGPINGYDSLRIHYQFHTAREAATTAPVVTWHNGGPGSSSILHGLYGEMGAFIIGEKENYLNPWAWNRIAHMLYLESPAGSGEAFGYSQCIMRGKATKCSWDDKSQAEAYAHTLHSFFVAFPEFSGRALYLTGESYFGQYGPNIARFILDHTAFSSALNLRGLALGNACWGGNATCVSCVGPSRNKQLVDLFFGKGLFAPKLKRAIDKECIFPTGYFQCLDDSACDCEELSPTYTDKCSDLLKQMFDAVGPYDEYNVYNNCPFHADGLRSKLHRKLSPAARTKALLDMNGGFEWDCLGNMSAWITRSDVRSALHLNTEPGSSHFDYVMSGPASVTLYPELVKKVQLLIYNGDADACVPYIGNEQWVDELERNGYVTETQAWEPWFASESDYAPAGYVTRYAASEGAPEFSFATVRLAGHEVPQYQPRAGFALFADFIGRGQSQLMVV